MQSTFEQYYIEIFILSLHGQTARSLEPATTRNPPLPTFLASALTMFYFFFSRFSSPLPAFLRVNAQKRSTPPPGPLAQY